MLTNKNIIKRKKYKHIKQIEINLNNDIHASFHKLKINYDIIVVLPGVLLGRSLSEYNSKNIISNFNINFTSQAILLNKILKKQKKNCLIIFISSISARRGSYDPIYAAAKGTMISFSKSLSLWLSPKIKCLTICPGLIKDTNMYKSFTVKRLNNLKKQTPNKEFLNSKDLSKIICDIIQSHWRHTNGAIIDINGGLYS